VGFENRHPVRRERTVRPEVVAHGCSDVHLRERAAAFLRRLCATATAQSDHADAEAARYYSWDERERLKPGV
jgi:hypothetical protein